MGTVFATRWRASRGRLILTFLAIGCIAITILSNSTAQVFIQGGGVVQLGGRLDVLGAGGVAADGFTVRKVAHDVAEAMEEFERYSGKGEWEKAFSTLPSVVDSPSSGLVAAGDGLFLPMRSRFRQLLVGLNPAGREAYRVFNDAPARQGLTQLTESDDPNAPAINNEVTRLQELYDKYFITTVGDQIGDRLGDAKFEAGDFSGAAECWQGILRDFPDSTLSPMRLHVKRAIALARARRWEDFSASAAYIREKFPTEMVRLGGKEVPARSVVDELARAMPATGAVIRVDPARPAPIRFPQTDDPLWQCVFADDAHLAEVERLFRGSGMAGSTLNPAMVSPRITADEKRIFLNWFGILMVVDIETGKMISRSKSFTNLAPTLQQVIALGFDSASDQTIVHLPGKERLLVVSPSLVARQVVQAVGGAVMRVGSGQIACYSTTDFRSIWSSDQSGLATWTLLGTPMVEGETIYATGRALTTTTGSANTAMELSLLAIDATNGRLLWTLPLGSMSAATNVRGMASLPKPVLLRVRDTIYVQTGNSAVVAVNVQSKRVEWAFCWGKAAVPPPAGVAPQQVPSYVYRQVDPLQCPSSIAYSEAGLFVKDRNSATLYAIDVNGPSLKWSRPVELSSSVAGADENSVYLLGRQLDCVDVRSKELRWSSKTPGINGGVEPLAIGSHLYVFGARGVYDLDLTNGDPKIFYGYDRDSFGGSMRRVGDRLICVSNRSVTAYPLPAN